VVTSPDPAAFSRETAGRRLFGDGYTTALEFDRLLCGEGVRRGLVGPREAERMWDRHVLNCAAIAPAFPPGASVVDVGSGAGLPGVALAIARPDLRIVLLEPLLRRSTFLSEAVEALGLARVEVRRGRAEELHGQVVADVVTARAVAPLDRLAGWCLPLVRPGGSLLAMKGARAAEELSAAADLLTRLGAADWSVEVHGAGVVDPAVRLVRVTAGGAPSTTTRARSGRAQKRQEPGASPGRRRDTR
jgi:16S rRNA (guanine527-N7)-methyltransferase